MDWFSLGFPPRDPAVGRPGVLGFCQYVEDRIDRALRGRPWLKRRFSAVDEIQVSLRSADIGRAEVVEVDVKRGSRKRVAVVVSVPSAVSLPKPGLSVGGAWFAGRLDGLLGYRLTLLALEAIDEAGRRLDLGPCELRSPGQDRGTDELPLFEAPDPAEGEINHRIAAELAAAPPGTWVTTGPVPPKLQPWSRAVAERLGARRVDQPLPAPLATPAGAEELIRVEAGPGWPRDLGRKARAAAGTAGYWLGQWGDFASSALPHPVRIVLVPAAPPPEAGADGDLTIPVDDFRPDGGTAILQRCLERLIRVIEESPRPDSREVFLQPVPQETDDTSAAGLDFIAEGELAVVTRLPPDTFDETLEWLEDTLDGLADVGESRDGDEFTYWIVTPVSAG